MKLYLETRPVQATAADLAAAFWALGEDGQAEFFNELGAEPGLSTQLCYVMFSDKLTRAGTWAMSEIGEYSSRDV